MLERVKYQSNTKPEDFSIRSLGGEVYELISHSNVETANVSDGEGNQTTMHNSDMIIMRVELKSRSEAIVSLIRLKYSQDDEYALINKGIEDKNNQEYLDYRAYVSWCKVKSTDIFDL